ncbi:hypothetical protein [Ralstonia sp.]|nr:hypothetical protein [Ralstonia sp.]
MIVSNLNRSSSLPDMETVRRQMVFDLEQVANGRFGGLRRHTDA